MRWIFQARSSGRKALAGDGLVVAQHTADSSNTAIDAKTLGNAADMGLSKENHVNGKVRRALSPRWRYRGYRGYRITRGSLWASGPSAFIPSSRNPSSAGRPVFFCDSVTFPTTAGFRSNAPASHQHVMVTVAGEACFHDASEVSKEAQQPQSQGQEGDWIRTIVCRLVHLVQPTEVGKQATCCAVELRSRTHRGR